MFGETGLSCVDCRAVIDLALLRSSRLAPASFTARGSVRAGEIVGASNNWSTPPRMRGM